MEIRGNQRFKLTVNIRFFSLDTQIVNLKKIKEFQ